MYIFKRKKEAVSIAKYVLNTLYEKLVLAKFSNFRHLDTHCIDLKRNWNNGYYKLIFVIKNIIYTDTSGYTSIFRI